MSTKPSQKKQLSEPSAVLQIQQETKVQMSGPLPHPEVLGLYDKVIPGLAQKIVTSFESQYRHRHKMEEQALNGDIEAMRTSEAHVQRGQWLGFVIIVAVVGAGVWLITQGHDTAGASIVVTGVASIVATYFAGMAKMKK